MSGRPGYKVGRIRIGMEAAILTAAEREFAERGFSGASILRIAERAGISRPNVHYYYQSKGELYRRVLTRIVEMWNDSFPDITPEDDPAQALEAYIRAKLAFSRSNPQASKIFASEVLRGAPLLKDYLEQNHASWLKGKAEVIRAWIEQGKMDEVDPLHLIFMIWSSTQHYADFDVQVKTALGKAEYSEADFSNISRTVTHIILKGCGVKPSGAV